MSEERAEIALRDAFCKRLGKPAGSTMDFEQVVFDETPALRRTRNVTFSAGDYGVARIASKVVSKGAKAAHLGPWLDQEFRFLRRMEGRGLPVPQPLHLGARAFFFHMTRVPGRELLDHDLWVMKPPVFRRLAEGVVRTCLGISALFPDAESRAFITRRNGVTLAPEALVARLKGKTAQRIFGADTPKYAEAMREHADVSASYPPVVIHSDVRPTNIMIYKNNRFSGLIDFSCVDICAPTGLFVKFMAYADSRVASLCEIYSSASKRKVTPHGVALHELADDLSKRLTGWSPTDNADFEASARRALDRVERLKPALQIAVP